MEWNGTFGLTNAVIAGDGIHDHRGGDEDGPAEHSPGDRLTQREGAH